MAKKKGQTVQLSLLTKGQPHAVVQVAKGLPTVVTIASKDQEVARRAQVLLSNSRFRCYTTDDIEGILPAELPIKM